jgi:hypothetical protein
MRSLAILLALLLLCSARPGQSTTPHEKTTPADGRPRLVIGFCAGDGSYAFVPEVPAKERIAQIGALELRAAYGPGEHGATFWFAQEGKVIFSFKAKDLSAPGVWIALDKIPDPDRVAITYSDGGAIGNFHVRIFQINRGAVIDISKTVDAAVADFRSRHYCKERGNNVTALKWIKGDLLLMTEVYPTGDCGPDLGHIEAYRLSVPDGKILEHLTLEQLTNYPGVCVQNDDEN